MKQVIHISPFTFHAYWKIRKAVKMSTAFWILKFIVLLQSLNGTVFKMIHWTGNQFSQLLFKTTKDSSLQWFLYRLMHRILPVGTYLRKIQLKPNDTCNLCKEAVETIVHLFFECEKATYLWNGLHHRILYVIQLCCLEKDHTTVTSLSTSYFYRQNNLYICLKKEKLPNIVNFSLFYFTNMKMKSW